MMDTGGGAAAGTITGGADAGSGGGSAASWRDGLPEAIRADASLANFQDIGALAQGYLETKRAATARTPDFKTDDGLKAFSDAVRPAAATDYEVPAFDEGGAAMADAFKAFAHQTGLPPAWAKGTAEWFNGQMKAAMEAEATRSQGEVDTLKGKMGADAFGKKLDAVSRMLPQLGVELSDDDLGQLDRKLGSSNLLTFMFAIADRVGDPATLENAGGQGGHGVLSPVQAKERWDALKQDRDWRAKAAKTGTSENAEYQRLQAAIAQGKAAANRGR